MCSLLQNRQNLCKHDFHVGLFKGKEDVFKNECDKKKIPHDVLIMMSMKMQEKRKRFTTRKTQTLQLYNNTNPLLK